MRIRVEPPSSHTVAQVNESDSDELDYTPVFFRETAISTVHTGHRFTAMTDSGAVQDVVTVILNGKTGKLSLRHQPLEAVQAPLDVPEGPGTDAQRRT